MRSAGSRKHRDHAVVILLGQRVVFVIVAAGATHRDAEERRAGRGHHVVQLVLPGPFVCMRTMSPINGRCDKSPSRQANRSCDRAARRPPVVREWNRL